MLHTILLLAMVEGASLPPMTAPEIVDRLLRADNERLAAFPGYTGMRRYRFENKKVNKRAEMTVRVTCDHTGAKRFEVVEESGSGIVRSRVIRKMIEAEQEASVRGEREQTRIIPANYDFRLIQTDVGDGRMSYVLEITPKTRSKFVICGRIWVDANDFAITRIEGQPAKNPSFWIRSAHVVQRYERTGRFWLPVLNHSRADARVFGATEVSIEYFDYVPAVQGARGNSSRPDPAGQ